MNDILDEFEYSVEHNIKIIIKKKDISSIFERIKNYFIKKIDDHKYDILFGFIMFFIISYIFIKSLLISIIEI